MLLSKHSKNLSKVCSGAIALFVVATTVPAKKKPEPPLQVIELMDVPLQREVFEIPHNKVPQQCTGSIFSGEVCWKVQAIAWARSKTSERSISLLVNYWANSSTGIYFTYAALTISIDGKVTDLPALNWIPGPSPYDGNTATIEDDSLIHDLAKGKEVWLTALATPRVSVKLSPRQIEAISLVVDRYDSLAATQH